MTHSDNTTHDNTPSFNHSSHGMDSDNYRARKKHFQQMLTVYGRLTVMEALQCADVTPVKLHLADSNKKAKVLSDIAALATKRGAEICYHDRLALSRISKNAKQDQGVALDTKPRGFKEFDADQLFAEGIVHSGDNATPYEFIALDRITNPQNLGMIIRSICASPMQGLILPRKGCANLDALVIKASTGTLFKAPIFRCDKLTDTLENARHAGFTLTGLDLTATQRFSEIPHNTPRIFVLGNESEGISEDVRKLCTEHVHIPMMNEVESLNVAVTAGLIALRHVL